MKNILENQTQRMHRNNTREIYDITKDHLR